jgi:hypothetical protein
VGVAAEEQRSVDPALPAVVADGLARGDDVVFVERQAQAGAAVAGGAERDLLLGERGVGMPDVVGGHQVRHVG